MSGADRKMPSPDAEAVQIHGFTADVRVHLADILRALHKLQPDANDRDFAHKHAKHGEDAYLTAIRVLNCIDDVADGLLEVPE